MVAQCREGKARERAAFGRLGKDDVAAIFSVVASPAAALVRHSVSACAVSETIVTLSFTCAISAQTRAFTTPEAAVFFVVSICCSSFCSSNNV